MTVPLVKLASCIPVLAWLGPKNQDIQDLCYDSRDSQPGSLFFALPGLHTDGAKYIPQAIAKGAVAIIHADPIDNPQENISYLQVADPRFSMSPIAAEFYDNPSKDLIIIGVTGTEGKSTTVSLIFQLLKSMDKKAGFISTVDYSLGLETLPNPEHQTTPEALTIHKKLYQMKQNGVEYAVIESSSHGLSPKTNRLGNVLFDVGVMTNVRHEHLEFHGTHEQYKSDKANLFRALDAHDHIKNGKKITSFGVINEEDAAAAYFRSATSQPVYGFSTWATTRKGLSASQIKSDANGINFVLSEPGDRTYEVRSDLPGAFNVYNLLAAMIVVSKLLEIPADNLLNGVSSLKPVKGRMTVIEEGQAFEVIVDYAHTPSSFLAIFPPLRNRIAGKIISVFGSGGERDTLKRPEQGQIASAYSDILILADEDPRNEDPVELLEMIAQGATGRTRNVDLFIIPNRHEAIRKAFSLAQKGDLVLLLGKGHENSIIHKDYTEPYDEISEAQTALHEMGFKKE